MKDKITRQSGFTLIELMVALTISLILMLALTTMYFDAIRNSALAYTQTSLNREARSMFRLLAFGQPVVNVNDIAGTWNIATNATHNYLFGLRGRIILNAARNGFDPPLCDVTVVNNPICLMDRTAALVPSYRLAFSPQGALPEGLVAGCPKLMSASVPAIALACTGAGTPLVDCLAAANPVAGITTSGYLRGTPALAAAGAAVAGQQFREVMLPLIDPYAAGSGLYPLAQVSDVYWTVFTLNVELEP